MATPSKPPTNRPTGSGAPAVNKKIAKAARAGGGPSRRSRKGSDSFNLTVIGVCIAGVALIGGSIFGRRILESAPFIGTKNPDSQVYESNKIESARKAVVKLQSVKKPDAKKIQAATTKFTDILSDSHWHSAYAIYNCDHWEPAINANSFADTAGIHAHDDGLMHIHPFIRRAAGKKARLGLFLDAVYTKITDTQLQWPSGSSGTVAVPTAKMMTTLKVSDGCKIKGKKVVAEVSVWKWDGAKDTTAEIYRNDFRSIPLVRSGGYAFVFAPKGTKNITIPASISAVEAPADVTATTVPAATTGSTIVVGGSSTTIAGGTATTVAGSTATTVAGGTATTVPATSASTTAAATSTTVATPTTTAAAAATTTKKA